MNNIENIKLPTNKKFGFFFASVFFFVAVYFTFKMNYTLSVVFYVLSMIFILLVFFNPSSLTLPKILWMKLGLLLGRIINPIILGIMFIIFITPIGLIMKLFGRDELKVRMTTRDTYWKANIQKSTVDESFKNQF